MAGAWSVQSVRRMRWLVALSVASVAMMGLPAVASAAALPSADLSITLDHSPSSLRTGDVVTFTLVATNSGPGTATNVVVAQQFEYYFTLQSVSSTLGTCSGQQLVVCRVASLPSGQSVTATIRARAQAAGLFDELAVVSSDNPDPDHADREAHEALIVEEGPTFAQQYAAALFRDILGRPGGASELTYWANQVDQARFDRLTRVPLSLLSSGEYRRKRIAAAYLTLLGRAASAADEGYWSGFLARHGSFEQMGAILVGSSEFARHAGGGTDQFITSAYQGILGRPADAGALTFWRSRLGSGVSHSSVAYAIQFSDEGLNRLVTARFQTALHVNPTTFDRFIWFGELRRGVSAEVLWSSVFASGPYQGQFVDSGSIFLSKGVAA